MKKLHILFLPVLSIILALSFNSCEGCVKKVTKKATNVTISAVEGVVEAVDERGEELAEKTTDAAGKVAVGTGRSLDKLINEHADDVAAATGRTLVQSIDGLMDGLDQGIRSHYDAITVDSHICSGVKLDLFGKVKSRNVIDAYFIITEEGTYTCKFEFNNNSGKIFLTKEAEIVKGAESHYSRVSFALDGQQEEEFKDIKDVKITVTKK
jgi:hypothetical protein